MSISNGDMVWIVALNKSKEANMVRCKVESIVCGLNSAYYNLIATDNPNWEWTFYILDGQRRDLHIFVTGSVCN